MGNIGTRFRANSRLKRPANSLPDYIGNSLTYVQSRDIVIVDMRHVLATGAMLAAFALSAQAAGDAKLEGLQEWFSGPVDEREPSYPFVRCAGLYMASLGYAGEKRLGQETSEKFKESIIMLSFGAMMLRSDRSGGDPMDYEEQVRKDRERIFHIYVDRMHANYAATGQAIMSDDLIKSDLMLCRDLAEEMAR